MKPSTASPLFHSKYRPDIDGLRAIAILSVVAYHAFPDLVQGGFIGVDIFFVISGFLISTIIFESLQRGSFSFIEFYSRRIRRLFPALIVVLAACFAYGWFILLTEEYTQLGKHIAGGAGFIANFMLWQESGYFDNAADTKPLLHLWSLGIEEQFYIFWPLLLWMAWKKKLNWLLLSIVIAVASFALNVKNVDTDAVVTFYSPLTRFWELPIGAFLASIALSRKNNHNLPPPTHTWLDNKTAHNLQSLLGGVLIASGLFLITKEKQFPGMWALFPTLGAALIIFSGSQAWLNRVLLSNRLLVWVGLISYPLYLWHWPVLTFTRLGNSTLTPVALMTADGLSIVLAWLTYRLIEKPIRFGKDSKSKTIALVLLMVTVGGVGYSAYHYKGFGFRLPEMISGLTDYNLAYKPQSDYRSGTCFQETLKIDMAFSKCKVEFSENKKTLLIWGDSYSAHLYPGYRKHFGKDYNVDQRSISSCAPFLNVEVDYAPDCKEANSATLEYIKKSKPDRVVLAAVWHGLDWKKLSETIAMLRKAGVRNIDLIGTPPIWDVSLQRQLHLYYKKFYTIPYRMDSGLHKDWYMPVESGMPQFAKEQGVNYISLLDILCNAEGCITRFGATGDTLSTWDNGHFTTIASEYVVSKFPRPK